MQSLWKSKAVCGGVLAVAFAPTFAAAQVVERHLPQAPAGGGGAAPLVGSADPDGATDATPIGPSLRAIVLLGRDNALATAPPAGVTFSGASRLKQRPHDLDHDLKPFLGQPLSRKLISDIKAALTRRYRQLGFPFVSLSTPQQDITDGALQVRVIEYRLGSLEVVGAGEAAKAAIASQISVKPGSAIPAQTLSDDLGWINRYPFRQVQAVFAPGRAPGETDLRLATNATRPWQVYAGYENSGSPSAGLDRYLVGATVGDLLGSGSLLSYQVTGSRNVFSGQGDPAYLSHAVSFNRPVGHHLLMEASLSGLESNAAGTRPFSTMFRVVEVSVGLRAGLDTSAIMGGQTDIRFGATANRQQSKIYFAGAAASNQTVGDIAAYVGLHNADQSPKESHSLDIALHLAPGGVGSENTDVRVALFNQGRQQHAEYAYVGVNYSTTRTLLGEAVWRLQVAAQAASGPLPRTAQGALGGASLVRGHSLDAGSFDDVLVVRNELSGAAWRSTNVAVRPFAFVDLGYGRDLATRRGLSLASTGLGATAAITPHGAIILTVARDLDRRLASKQAATLAHLAISATF